MTPYEPDPVGFCIRFGVWSGLVLAWWIATRFRSGETGVRFSVRGIRSNHKPDRDETPTAADSFRGVKR
jgi:hypothetical protein